MPKLQNEHAADFTDEEMWDDIIPGVMIDPDTDLNAMNFDTRRKIENLLEERSLRKLINDNFDFDY